MWQGYYGGRIKVIMSYHAIMTLKSEVGTLADYLKSIHKEIIQKECRLHIIVTMGYKDPIIVQGHFRSCRWSADARSQSSHSHGIDLAFRTEK